MDRITRSLFDEFVKENNIELLAEDEAFEYFAGYLVTSSHYSDSPTVDDIAVGAGGDTGIDCIGVIVNGVLVSEPEEVVDLAETNNYLDVSFVFTQAERSPNFDTAKMGQFAYGVLDFFSETPRLTRNERVELFARVTNEVFRRSALFAKGNPQCFMYYVTTGRWTNDANLLARREAVLHDVQALGLFRRVSIDYIDANRLQDLYRESKSALSTEIVLTSRTVFPEIPGVEQAYLGLLPAPQFLKLIENENEEVLASLFYDNVRHWQEWNSVNSEIKQTLSTPEQSVLFPLLNNGVTIVAKRLQLTGNKFLLEDYQIVNGCQTSYVLHEMRDNLIEQVMIPVRIIATQDELIKNKIIKATNRQTSVSEDQLLGLSEFPKRLEAYFPTFDGIRKLYYERRSRQFSADAEVEKVRVISMTTLVRAFASIFLEIPHRTTRNYKALLKTVGTDIFNKEHRLEPYYVSAFAHYRLEFLFRNQSLPPRLKPARFHILLAYRLLTSTDQLPALNSRAMERYCQLLMDSLWQEDESRDRFREAATRVETVSAGNLHRDYIRTEPFTGDLMASFNRGTARI